MIVVEQSLGLFFTDGIHCLRCECLVLGSARRYIPCCPARRKHSTHPSPPWPVSGLLEDAHPTHHYPRPHVGIMRWRQ